MKNRRVVIEIKVQEGTSDYDWKDVAEVGLQTSVELFNSQVVAQAVITAVGSLLEPPASPDTSASLNDLPF